MDLLILILLILAGFALILVEVYVIPGFNVVGILGFLLIVFAVGYVYVDQGLVGGTLALVASATLGVVTFWVLWKSKAWHRFVLSANLGTDKSTVVREHEQAKRLLGRTGRAITPLRPEGLAEFDDERLEVRTEHEFIAKGSEVTIVALSMSRHVVRLASDVD